MQQPAVVIFLITCLAACYTDVRSRRIPNYLTWTCCVTLAIVHATGGFFAFLAAVGAMAAVIVVGSFIYRFGAIGGGDIKLLAAGAGAFGFPSFFNALLYVCIAGGFLACIYALRENRMHTLFRNVAISAITGTAIVPATATRRIPYALAICAGSVVFAASEGNSIWSPLVH